MTFKEFKDKALHPVECEGAGVYKVRLLNYEIQSQYPIIELEEIYESLFPTYEEAIESTKAHNFSKTSKPYCGFISFHKYGENAQSGYFNKLWLFDPDGKPIDESLSPGTIECHYVPFRGRPQNLIRFKIGDIVEVLDIDSQSSSLAIIARQPLTIEQAWKINLRKNQYENAESPEEEIIEGRIATLMTEDDYYKVIYYSEERDNYVDSHVHPTLIMRPCKEVSNTMKHLLLKKLNSYTKINRNGKLGN